MIAGIRAEEEINFEAGCADGIFGDDEFIDKINGQSKNEEELGQVRIDSDTLIFQVCDKYQIDVVELQKSGMGRRKSHIRSVIALLARGFDGVSLEGLAKIFRRESSGLSKAATRLEIRMRRSNHLKKEIEDLKNLLA